MKKSILSPCKINFQLDIGEKKNDYHEIYTIMQTVSLYDTLTFDIKKNKNNIKNTINIKCNKYYIPTDDKNLCYKIMKYFIEKYNINDIINLYIKKTAPVGGGLGGGSSNCFYTLKFLNTYYKTNLTTKEIQNICNLFGSDISFFTVGGTCKCTGRGEIIEKINNFPKCFILLINPNFSMSTKKMYDEYDHNKKINYTDKKEKFLDIINNDNKNIKEISKYLFNTFENLAIEQYPKIQEIKDILIKYKAHASLMSGSGSTIYGIFTDYITAKRCQLYFIKNTKYFSMITKPI